MTRMPLGSLRLSKKVVFFTFCIFATCTVIKTEQLEIVSAWASPAREGSENWRLQDPTIFPKNPISAVYDGTNDDDNFHCYKADTRNAWATFQLRRMSFISNVTLQSTYSSAIKNVEVSVCSGFSSNCTFCGKTPDVEAAFPEFQVQCFDAKGDEVRIRKVNEDLNSDRDTRGGLELCRVEIFGPGCDVCCQDYHPACPALFDFEFYKIYLQRVTSGINRQTQIPPAPDCNNEFYSIGCPLSCGSCLPCYDTEKELNGLIRKYSSQVQLLTENIASVRNKVAKIHVSLNTEKEAVTDSYEIKVQELSGQIEIVRQVLEFPNNPRANGVFKLDIESAECSDKGTFNELLIGKSFDGRTTTGTGDCFISRRYNRPWANYFIGNALVKFVRILAGSDQAFAAASYHVSVCNDNKCTLCNNLGSLEQREFKTVDCGGSEYLGSGLKGDTVVIAFREERVQLKLCEVEIYGTR